MVGRRSKSKGITPAQATRKGTRRNPVESPLFGDEPALLPAVTGNDAIIGELHNHANPKVKNGKTENARKQQQAAAAAILEESTLTPLTPTASNADIDLIIIDRDPLPAFAPSKIQFMSTPLPRASVPMPLPPSTPTFPVSLKEVSTQNVSRNDDLLLEQKRQQVQPLSQQRVRFEPEVEVDEESPVTIRLTSKEKGKGKELIRDNEETASARRIHALRTTIYQSDDEGLYAAIAREATFNGFDNDTRVFEQMSCGRKSAGSEDETLKTNDNVPRDVETPVRATEGVANGGGGVWRSPKRHEKTLVSDFLSGLRTVEDTEAEDLMKIATAILAKQQAGDRHKDLKQGLSALIEKMQTMQIDTQNLSKRRSKGANNVQAGPSRAVARQAIDTVNTKAKSSKAKNTPTIIRSLYEPDTDEEEEEEAEEEAEMLEELEAMENEISDSGSNKGEYVVQGFLQRQMKKRSSKGNGPVVARGKTPASKSTTVEGARHGFPKSTTRNAPSIKSGKKSVPSNLPGGRGRSGQDDVGKINTTKRRQGVKNPRPRARAAKGGKKTRQEADEIFDLDEVSGDEEEDDDAGDEEGAGRASGYGCHQLGYYSGDLKTLIRQAIFFMRLFLLNINAYPDKEEQLKWVHQSFDAACQLQYGVVQYEGRMPKLTDGISLLLQNECWGVRGKVKRAASKLIDKFYMLYPPPNKYARYPNARELERRYVRQRATSLLRKESPFLCGCIEPDGAAVPYGHSAITELVHNLVFSKVANKRPLAGQDLEAFDPIPLPLIAYACTALLNGLQEYKSGKHVKREFSELGYRNYYKTIVANLERIVEENVGNLQEIREHIFDSGCLLLNDAAYEDYEHPPAPFVFEPEVENDEELDQ